MTARSDAALAFIDRWTRGGRPSDALAGFLALIPQFGMTMTCGACIAGFGARRTLRFLFNTWPKELQVAYMDEDMFWGDPMAAESRRRHRPFTFREIAANPETELDRDRMTQAAARFGQQDCLAFPLYAPFGYRGVVTVFAESDIRLSASDRALLAAAAECVFEIHRRASDLDAIARRAPLTPRERDSISLVAEGLTDDAIGRQLGLSGATVRHHVDNVRDKLGAASRAEAVALLAGSGEI